MLLVLLRRQSVHTFSPIEVLATIEVTPELVLIVYPSGQSLRIFFNQLLGLIFILHFNGLIYVLSCVHSKQVCHLMEYSERDIVVGVQAVETLRYDTFQRSKVHAELSRLDFYRGQNVGGVARVRLLIIEHFLQGVLLSATCRQHLTDRVVLGYVL